MNQEFEIVGQISGIETIAVAGQIRELHELRARFGYGRWRKLKGFASVLVPDGRIRSAEVHWYEAHGVGKVRMKIKRYLD
jgi:hypothetical protein